MSRKTKTTATKEEAKPALAPKLRFPEFRAAVGWREGQIADIAVSESSSRALNKLSLKSEGFPVYGADSCVGFIDSFDQADDYIAIVKDGSGVGRLALKKGKSSILGTLAYIKCKPRSETKLIWLYYCLNSLDLRQFIKGSGIPHIYFSDYATHGVLIPPPPEQQKIAECLSSVDELIAAQARKVDALKTHKKGLMQQLFPREGETQPRLRFPEFKNAGGWEEVPLGEIAEIKLGKMLDKQKHTTGHLLPYLNNLAVRWNEVNTTDLPKMYFTDRELDRFGLRAGDVVVCEGGEPGRAAVWDGRLPDLKFQKAIHRVRFNIPFEPKILVQHLENLAGTTAFEMLFTGGGIKHLTGETFSRLKVPLIPYSEQQRIATCLSSLDALITAETQKLEALKAHKKGLMQQLFPAPTVQDHTSEGQRPGLFPTPEEVEA